MEDVSVCSRFGHLIKFYARFHYCRIERRGGSKNRSWSEWHETQFCFELLEIQRNVASYPNFAYHSRIPAKAEAQHITEKWHVAYHGTHPGVLRKILDSADLLMTGR